MRREEYPSLGHLESTLANTIVNMAGHGTQREIINEESPGEGRLLIQVF